MKLKTMRTILIFLLTVGQHLCIADYLIVGRNATLKAEPNKDAVINAHLLEGDMLELLADTKTNGYYYARISSSVTSGWIYQTLVRRYAGEVAPGGGSSASTAFPNLSLESVMPSAGAGDVIIAHEGYTSCQYDLQNLPECNGNKSCAGIYSGRKKPEDRDKLICK